MCKEFIAADENGRKAMRAEVERAEGFLEELRKDR